MSPEELFTGKNGYRGFIVKTVKIESDKSGNVLRFVGRNTEAGRDEDVLLFFPAKLVKQMQKASAEVKQKA